VADHLHRLLNARPDPPTFLWGVLDRWHSAGGLVTVSVPALPLLAWLVGEGIWTRLTEGHVYQHWSRAVLAGMIAFGLAQMTVTVLITNLLRFHTRRAAAQRERRLAGVTPRTKDAPTVAPRSSPTGVPVGV